MAKVIKPFKDKKDNLKLYDPKKNNHYSGDRKVELFKKGFLDITITEIKDYLDKNEIEYNEKAKKQDLMKLIK